MGTLNETPNKQNEDPVFIIKLVPATLNKISSHSYTLMSAMKHIIKHALVVTAWIIQLSIYQRSQMVIKPDDGSSGIYLFIDNNMSTNLPTFNYSLHFFDTASIITNGFTVVQWLSDLIIYHLPLVFEIRSSTGISQVVICQL